MQRMSSLKVIRTARKNKKCMLKCMSNPKQPHTYQFDFQGQIGGENRSWLDHFYKTKTSVNQTITGVFIFLHTCLHSLFTDNLSFPFQEALNLHFKYATDLYKKP